MKISCTQQGRQREPSVKMQFSIKYLIIDTLCVEWRNSTLLYAILSERRNENNSVPEWESNPQPSRLQTLPLRYDGLIIFIL